MIFLGIYILAQELTNAGYKANIEQNGGSDLGDKPGDILVDRWNDDKDLLIDTAVIKQKNFGYKTYLADEEAGAAATVYEGVKRTKYAKLIDWTRFNFLPFILEVQGGIGSAAEAFFV